VRFLTKSIGVVFGLALIGSLFGELEDPKPRASVDHINSPIQTTPLLLEQDKVDVLIDNSAISSPNIVTRASAPSNTTVKPAKIAPSTPVVLPPKYQFVTGSVVNVRAGPSTGNKVLTKVRRHDRVKTIGVAEIGWQRIETPVNGTQGWMAARYLTDQKPVTPSQASANASPTRRVAVPSTADITRAKKAIIQQSIASYHGSCPCPYNRDRAGRRCGKRSAWSKPGGYSPLCYESDVSAARVKTHLARLRGATN